MGSPVKQQAAGTIDELIQDGEDRRGKIKGSDNFRDVREDWLKKAFKAIEEVEASRVLPADSFNEFNNPDITGTLCEYEAGIAGEIAAADATRRAFDGDLNCLRKVRRSLLAS
jgi:hypothetical protein